MGAYAIQPEIASLVSVDRNIHEGKPYFTGTDVALATVLDDIQSGIGLDGVLAKNPALSRKHVLAVTSWQADLARQVLQDHVNAHLLRSVGGDVVDDSPATSKT